MNDETSMVMEFAASVAILAKIKPEELAKVMYGKDRKVTIYLGELAVAVAKMRASEMTGKIEEALKKVKEMK